MNARTALAIALLCVSQATLSACGAQQRAFTSKTAERAAPHGSSANAIPTLLRLSGDYDNDDYYRHGSDGDNDDENKPRDRDFDFDSHGGYYDPDDNSLRGFGHAADPANRRAITALVRRYYAAAVAEDGAAACSLLTSAVAGSIPETLGKPPGPPFLYGSTCATVASKAFKQDHPALAIYAKTMRFSDVRLSGERGVVVLDMGKLPGRQTWVQREGGVWRMEWLLDDELP